MKSIYKSIGNIMDINIINIIALFAIQECDQCNKTYPKSWTIIQPDIMMKLVNNFRPKIDTQLLFDNDSKYELRYCKSCNVEQERDIMFNAIYNHCIDSEEIDVIDDDIKDIMGIIDIITSYSIGSILIC